MATFSLLPFLRTWNHVTRFIFSASFRVRVTTRTPQKTLQEPLVGTPWHPHRSCFSNSRWSLDASSHRGTWKIGWNTTTFRSKFLGANLAIYFFFLMLFFKNKNPVNEWIDVEFTHHECRSFSNIFYQPAEVPTMRRPKATGCLSAGDGPRNSQNFLTETLIP